MDKHTDTQTHTQRRGQRHQRTHTHTIVKHTHTKRLFIYTEMETHFFRKGRKRTWEEAEKVRREELGKGEMEERRGKRSR